MSCEILCKNDSDLESIVDVVRPFKLDETIRNPVVISNSEIIASFMSVRKQWYQGEGPIPENTLDEMARKLNLGRWNASFALYGDEAKVQNAWKRIQNAAKHIKGVEFVARTYELGDKIIPPRDQGQAGIPSLNEFSLVNWRGAGGHIDFSPVGPMRAKDARKMNDMVRRRIHEYGFDHLGGFYCDARAFRCVNTLVFQKNIPAEMEKIRKLFGVLVDDFAHEGYGEYRTHLAYMDQVAKTYDFNNNALLRFQKQLKSAIDLQGINAPGKSGVWP